MIESLANIRRERYRWSFARACSVIHDDRQHAHRHLLQALRPVGRIAAIAQYAN